MAASRTHVVVGISALLAFVVETLLLGGRLEWFDAWVTTAVRAMQTDGAVTIMASFTQAAPFVGAAFVIAGLVLAVRDGADAGEIAAILAQLAVGLLLAWAMKGFFHRARPGALPWDLEGDSFPSGHVANAVLCLGTALRLVPGRRWDGTLAPSRIVLFLAGCAYVLVVAFTRVVLARHWLTDVTGSLLLCTAFVALAPAPRLAVTRALLLATPVVLLGMWVSIATGTRITLPSPSSIHGGAPQRLRMHDDFLRAIEIDDEGLVAPSPGAEEFMLLSPILGKQLVEVRNGRSAILKLLARTHLDETETRARRLELLIDGALVGVLPLETRWRTLAFALPELEPGLHEFELLPRARPLTLPRAAQSLRPRSRPSAR